MGVLKAKKLAAMSANDLFCFLGLSTWSQHSRSHHRRSSCSRQEDRKPSEVFVEYDCRFVASPKYKVHVCSGHGSLSSELLFIFFLLHSNWHLLPSPLPFYFWPGDHRAQLPALVSVREFWHSLTSIQHSCRVL